ncbi:MAG: transposase [Geminicoccaceae bacterium]|nr:transposase [Geminicoccaceae bacterium]
MRPRGAAIGGDPRPPIGPCRRAKGGQKGYDAGKKITGRKRHVPTDTDGRPLAVRVHGADVQDRDGGRLPLKGSRQRDPFVTRVFADGGCAGRLVQGATGKTDITLEMLRRGAPAKGFEAVPRRWVVERTFPWIFKNCRLARDCEQPTAVAETLITIAASATLLRRWT